MPYKEEEGCHPREDWMISRGQAFSSTPGKLDRRHKGRQRKRDNLGGGRAWSQILNHTTARNYPLCRPPKDLSLRILWRKTSYPPKDLSLRILWRKTSYVMDIQPKPFRILHLLKGGTYSKSYVGSCVYKYVTKRLSANFQKWSTVSFAFCLRNEIGKLLRNFLQFFYCYRSPRVNRQILLMASSA